MEGLNFKICPFRLPTNVNDNVEEDPTGIKSLWDRGLLSGASQKAEGVSVFHVGETIRSLQVNKDCCSLCTHDLGETVLAFNGMRKENVSKDSLSIKRTSRASASLYYCRIKGEK